MLHFIIKRLLLLPLLMLLFTAVIFALLNFDQRSRFEVVYDGVTWFDTDHGIQARTVAPNSPANRAGIRAGDILLTFNGVPASRATDVTRRLDRAGAPACPVEYAVFHAMLHLKHPTRRSGCSLLSHSPQFREEEKRYPDYARARKYLDRLA